MRFRTPTQRLTIYIGESDQWKGRPLWQAILQRLREEGVAGATVIRGMAGFGAHSRIHTVSLVRLSSDLPIIIEVVDEEARLQQVLPALSAMVREGLITLEPVKVVKYAHRRLPALGADVRVADIMSRNVQTVHPTTPAHEVARLLLRHAFRAVPVVDEEGRVVGIISDGDVLRRGEFAISAGQTVSEATIQAALADLAASNRTAADLMTTPVETIQTTAPAIEAATRMAHRGLKRLPVVDEQGRLVGMLSRIDILRAMTDTLPAENPPPVFIRATDLISKAITQDVPRLPPEAPLSDVATAIVGSSVRQVIVVDEEEHPLGVITDGTLIRWAEQRQHGGLVRALLRYFVPQEALSLDDATTARLTPSVTIRWSTSPTGVSARMVFTGCIKSRAVVASSSDKASCGTK